MNRFTCDWIFNILVVLSDGRVVCGCADPYGERPLGDINDNSLEEIWNSPLAVEIRRGLNRGYSPFCIPCGLKREVGEKDILPDRDPLSSRLTRIFFEPTVLCNLSCLDAVCSRESQILTTRRRFEFPLEEMKRILETVGKKLVRIDFFNYGDPFCHPQAVEMAEWIKKRFPQIYFYTSTNGLMLTEEKMQGLIDAGIDEITFSVDGADPETYRRYRRGGDFHKVMGIMKRFAELREQTGKEIPFINWRYILFRWNDGRRQMNRARKLAGQIGADRLIWEITDHPADAYSLKFVPGSPPWKKIYHEIWDSSQIGSAIKGKRFLASFRRIPPIVTLRPGQPASVAIEVKNRGGALWRCNSTSGRRLVRLGAQLFSREKKLIDLNFARAFLDRSIGRGETIRVKIELPPLDQVGEFWLKWDMVSEGVDWFENGGSQAAWSRLVVRS